MEVSNTTTELRTENLKADPYLEDFERLGPQIFFYKPAAIEVSGDGHETSSHPGLLLVCSWMFASSRNVKKYMTGYKALFPRTPILLLKQDGNDIFWNSNATQTQNLQPAFKLINELVQSHKPGKLRVLMHVFSNGGSYSAIFMTDRYLEATGELFPISALVLDSTPSLPSASRAVEAISESLPKAGVLRLVGKGGIWAYLLLTELARLARGQENFNHWLRRKLNDPKGPFTQDTIKRVYIYSPADTMVPAAEVELHAREAADVIGEERVQTENFVTSRHVGHMIADPERYWKIIHDLWRGTVVGH